MYTGIQLHKLTGIQLYKLLQQINNTATQ